MDLGWSKCLFCYGIYTSFRDLTKLLVVRFVLIVGCQWGSHSQCTVRITCGVARVSLRPVYLRIFVLLLLSVALSALSFPAYRTSCFVGFRPIDSVKIKRATIVCDGSSQRLRAAVRSAHNEIEVGIKMSKVYDSSFKVGVIFTLLAFLCLNAFSYVTEYRRFHASKIRFSNSFYWGFPYSWSMDDTLAFAVNIAVIAASCFIIGFLFKLIYRRLR